MRKWSILFLLLFSPAVLLSCRPAGGPSGQERPLQVVTTLFPLYDFARNVGGRKANVTLLLPPGVEPHSFEPRPRDILRINQADLFIFTGPFMEPWAGTLVKSEENRNLVVVNSSNGVDLLHHSEGGERHGEGGSRAVGPTTHEDPVDPHIWLDLVNAQKMTDTILAGFAKKDPKNKGLYEENASAYKAKLRRLDEEFRNGLNNCKTRLFVHGGHYAFNYLARRYDLTYVSAYGSSPNAEPSPRHLAEIIQKIRQQKVGYVFYEELIQPRLAETIARETGARLLPLNGGHNVSKEELDKGVTFISLLQQDLTNLKIGLQCR